MPRWAEYIVNLRWFQRGVVLTILLAGILAGVETSQAITERYGDLLMVLNTVVLAIFVGEIGLKMLTHGREPWRYFQDGWNVFDFVVVAVCCLPMDTQFSAVLRLARALRLLRLLSALPRLQLLAGALLKSIASMGYVGLLLALLFYIYGVTGVHLFGATDPQHFGRLPQALLTLFRVMTLENWGTIFDLHYYGSATGANPPVPITATIYFISFIVLGTMIMLNLFIGVIMNSMSEMQAEINARARSRHLAEDGETTLDDELRLLERQLDELKAQAVRLRRRASHRRPAAAPGIAAQLSATAETLP